MFEKGLAMATGQSPMRTESRTPKRVYVELYSFEHAAYELTYTVDVSSRGARVLSKDLWISNQHLTVRSVEGHLYSRARVAYCLSTRVGTFAIGLQLDQPCQEWAPPSRKSAE